MMRKQILFVAVIFCCLAAYTNAQCQERPAGQQKAPQNVILPEVPRVSAYESYKKYKEGKALIVHAGGESFKRRHIMGAFDVTIEALRKGRIKLPKFPKSGFEIFIYCY